MTRKRTKREKAKGRLDAHPDDNYAQIPVDVMRSTAWQAVPDWAIRVAVAVASRFSGSNNGNLSLPFSEARERGISQQWKLYAGLRVLEKTGLVLCTRRGHVHKTERLCSLYALGWRPLDLPPLRDGQDYDAGNSRTKDPPNVWAQWSKPTDWLKSVQTIARTARGRNTADAKSLIQRVGKTDAHTTGGGAGRTLGGGAEPSPATARKGDFTPPVVDRKRGGSAPPVVVASEILGVGGGSRDQKIRSLHASGIGVPEIARMLHASGVTRDTIQRAISS